jgi:hypothetical protein
VVAGSNPAIAIGNYILMYKYKFDPGFIWTLFEDLWYANQTVKLIIFE